MAFVSIAKYRSITGVSVATQDDASAGMFLGGASALFLGITGRQLGHHVESLSIDAKGVLATCYGHMLEESGYVKIVGSGNSGFDGEYAYEWVSEDQLLLLGAALPPNVSSAKLLPRHTGDFEILDSRVRADPPPVHSVSELRIDDEWDSRILASDIPFPDESVVPAGDYYVVKEAREVFQSEVQIKLASVRPQRVRVPGFVRAVRKQTRKIARMIYFAGTMNVPLDAINAIASIAQLIKKDPLGELQSESLEYYSYSRRSLQDVKGYPISVIATLNRYKVTR